MNHAFLPAAVFGDHMVLRRDHPALVFGEAAEGTVITASIGSLNASATARGGRFTLTLPPSPAGGPHTLTLTDGETAFTYTDVYFGEVYLAGGQSNMEWELKNALDGERYIAEADLPLVRYYNVPKSPYWNAQAQAAERAACWRAVAPGACGDMSAVAFHFAARLQAELGVAVGVIDCYWGGTAAACWMDEAALRSCPEGAAMLLAFEASITAKTQAECDEDVRRNDRDMEIWNGQVEKWRTERPDLSWTEVSRLVGACPWGPPPNRKSAFRPAGLVETMVKRVAPYTLSGFLFYQGEEDVQRAGQYRALLGALIACWRRLFRNIALPFLFVQLPMYRSSDQRDDRLWAVLREAQAQVAQTVQNTGLAVMIDGGELDNIHPTDKKTVGDRLFWEALRVVYGRADALQSPCALYTYRDGAALVVALTAPVHAHGEARLFELADADGVYQAASAELCGATVRLTAEGIAEPVAARYAWINFDTVNVFGENGLPLAPFRLEL